MSDSNLPDFRTPINPTYEPRVREDGLMKVGSLVMEPVPDITALLYGFAHSKSLKAKEYYFWRVSDTFWNYEGMTGAPQMVRNPWSEYMVRNVLKYGYLAIGGAASSAKSHTMAAFAIICWASEPADTQVLITSTSITASRKRIWGSVVKLLSPIEEFLPCKIRDSLGTAPYVDANGTVYDQAGLALVAAEKSKTRQAVGKLIGAKAGIANQDDGHIIVIGDELSELSPALIEACMTNLAKNSRLTVVGMSNPNSQFDAFGDWATPKEGWESINVMMDYEWDTKYGGRYIRLDGEKSPNIEAGEEIYKFLPTQDQMDRDKELLGAESRGYLRMNRAIFFDSDDDEVVFTESEIIKSGGMGEADWESPPTVVAGLDPAFTNGGDRTMLHIGRVGYETNGSLTFEFGECYQINDDASDTSTPRNYQIVNKVKQLCVKLGVSPENLAVDATGAGTPFCDILAGEWSMRFQRVQFGGKPSDRRVSDNNPRKADELYINKVTELWFMAKELLRTKQLKGLYKELVQEIVKRGFETRKVVGLKVFLEPKSSFKNRIGMSPDRADAGFLAIEAARRGMGLVAMSPIEEGGKPRKPRTRRTYKQLREVLETDDSVMYS